MSSIEQIKITKTDEQVEVQWPNGTIHDWHPKKDADQDWHKLINNIADCMPYNHGPVPCSTASDKGAGGLQYDLADGIVALCDKYHVSIEYDGHMWWCRAPGYSLEAYPKLEDLLETTEKVLSK